MKHIIIEQELTEDEAIRFAEQQGAVVVMVQTYYSPQHEKVITDIWCAE